jgi:hypothetical protein
MMKILILRMRDIQFHCKPFVMVSFIYYHKLSKIKMKQMKEIVNIGHLFIFIIDVMGSGMFQTVLMKLIVMNHHYRIVQ